MSYRLNQVKALPVAAWMLDDTIPFAEHSGSGFAGTASAQPPVAVPTVAYAAYSSVFYNGAVGTFTSPLFKKGQESKQFALEGWVYQSIAGKQQILSHSGQYDGLWIDGTSVHFSTVYANSGICDTFFDLDIVRAAYVVGQHTDKYNELWVDGVLVMRTELTDAQKNDLYITTDGNLYCGGSPANTSRLTANALAVYNGLTTDQIAANFKAGRNVISQASVASQYNGVPLYLSSDVGSTHIERTWSTDADFNQGMFVNAAATQQQVRPLLEFGETMAGSWSTSVALDASETNTCYGVMVEWSGKNIVVEGRIDNGAWAPLASGKLVSDIPSGFTTTNKYLEVRVTLLDQYYDGEVYLESLTIIGFRNNSVSTSESRVITASYPAVLRKDFEPILYRDDNGISLNGGTLTIGPDTSEEANAIKSIEFWIKPTGSYTINGNTVGGFVSYKSGVASAAAAPVGEWSLVHYVSNNDITGNITVSGNVIVGQAALYPDTLTATDVSNIFKGYTGAPVLSFNDTSAIGITEYSVVMYINDWSIENGG